MRIAGATVALGETRDLLLPVSQQYSGLPVHLPLRVWRAEAPGPTVLISAAIHGDELNGTGIIRALAASPPFALARGTLVLAPVLNILGFERHSRYLPDRRDLNRSFPGRAAGSLASRYAAAIFEALVPVCDFAIDLHSAAVRRTNFPNVRADLSKAPTRRLAMAFGCELVLHGKGPQGSLRRTATEAGCPSIILEAGEVWKIEPAVVEIGLRGVRNVLIELDMVEGQPVRPPYQATVLRSTWVRAEQGGILQFHVAPGEPVSRRQALATVTDLLGRALHVLDAPRDGVVLGLSTMPAVKPGEPVCHLAHPQGGLKRIRAALAGADAHSLAERLRHDLATNVEVQAAGGG
ncbi:MAG: succinylglutamate desuccinylase/aspartoacylase family protein [Caldilineae bacterium]|nr:succinylglutamate desuccinylase/aspartoacylase family protein [Caldilineae bacterium]